MFTLQVHPPPLPSSLPSPPPNTTTQLHTPTPLPHTAACRCLLCLFSECRRKSPGPRRPLGPASSQILLPDIPITPTANPAHSALPSPPRPAPPRPTLPATPALLKHTDTFTRHRYAATLSPVTPGHKRLTVRGDEARIIHEHFEKQD